MSGFGSEARNQTAKAIDQEMQLQVENRFGAETNHAKTIP
jgi:hypothetical protein